MYFNILSIFRWNPLSRLSICVGLAIICVSWVCRDVVGRGGVLKRGRWNSIVIGIW